MKKIISTAAIIPLLFFVSYYSKAQNRDSIALEKAIVNALKLEQTQFKKTLVSADTLHIDSFVFYNLVYKKNRTVKCYEMIVKKIGKSDECYYVIFSRANRIKLLTKYYGSSRTSVYDKIAFANDEIAEMSFAPGTCWGIPMDFGITMEKLSVRGKKILGSLQSLSSFHP